ncbi:MAG: hypothetical protein AAFU70_05595 [Planctomycetota bacterium]
MSAETGTILTDEARLGMFRRASEAERANRPRWMILIAGLIFAGALGYALLGWLDRRDAIDTLRSARASDSNLTLVLDDIEQLRQPMDSGDIGPFPPLSTPQTLLQRLATQAGLDTLQPPTARVSEVNERISRRLYQYGTVRHPTAEALLRWLDSVEQNITGMRVQNIDLKPNRARNGWELSVTFSRLENSS